MKIRILDQETILKIAAGEVIERPASVVRELLDNAVDAGASSIGIEVFEGGLDRIIISDDGEGMTPEELRLAVERHATSKIAGAQDLFNISTMGFRGEALASIGAVSRLAITTRTRDAVAGCRLEVRGGEKGAVEATSSPQGTRVEVEGLFYNTPARMKFLRTPATEFSAIAEVVHRQVLARPGIRFRLSHNGKLVLVSPGAGSLVDAIACVAGTDIAEGLLECNLALDGYTVTGYIAKPAFHRSNRAMQYFTVNGRPVNVRLMGSAVEKAFHTLLPVRRFPIAFLNLDLPGDQVDVNVHPAKLEVKFTDSSAIFRLVYRACLEALTAVTGATLPKKEEGHMVEPDDVPISRPAASPRPWSRPYTPSLSPVPGSGSRRLSSCAWIPKRPKPSRNSLSWARSFHPLLWWQRPMSCAWWTSMPPRSESSMKNLWACWSGESAPARWWCRWRRPFPAGPINLSRLNSTVWQNWALSWS